MHILLQQPSSSVALKQHVAAKEPARVARQFAGIARSDPIPAVAKMLEPIWLLITILKKHKRVTAQVRM